MENNRYNSASQQYSKVIIVKIGSKLVLQHRAMLIIIKYEEFRSIVDDIGFRLEYWLKLF